MKNITPGAANTQGGKPKFNFFRFMLWFTALYAIAILWFWQSEPADTTYSGPVPQERIADERILVPFRAESLKGYFNTVGLRIDDAVLRTYFDAVGEDANNIRLLGFDEETSGDYVEVGFLPRGRDAGALPSHDTRWNVVRRSDENLALAWRNPEGAVFTRTFSVDEKYMLTVTDRVENSGRVLLSFYPYARIVRHNILERGGQPLSFSGFLSNRLETMSVRNITRRRVETFGSTGGWFGFSDNYFMTAVVIDNEGTSTIRVVDPAALDPTLVGRNRIQADVVGPARFLEPGESVELVNRIFIGAKQNAALVYYGNKYDIPRFDLAIDFGFFHVLAAPFAMTLRWLHGLTGNFGIAIIIFTVFMRLLMWPLTQKSIEVAERMRKLQPEMKRLQTLYSGDKMRQNMELAMLYKREKVNPAAGCLPLLLQLPVFIALYQALIMSIDMRHAPFMLWIVDLSAADPTTIFNLFGLMPFTPWAWLPHLGILPLFMGWTMWYQMKLQPASLSPEQAKIMRWMPAIFTLLFAGLPSGLVLYWTINNLLSIAQHKVTRKRMQ